MIYPVDGAIQSLHNQDRIVLGRLTDIRIKHCQGWISDVATQVINNPSNIWHLYMIAIFVQDFCHMNLE